MNGSLLHYEHVGMDYHDRAGETPVLNDINLDVEKGEFVALVGPSGCGKSTLLSLAAGLLKPDRGNVYLAGEKVDGPSRLTGYMLQHDGLFPWLNILDNALVGIKVRGQVSDADRERAMDLLESCGLLEFQNHFPRQLSGGMRQRAALVRTLAIEPELLLLDEPFSALDSQTRVKLSDEVAQIIRDRGKTALLVTHDISEAISMADRVVVLGPRPTYIQKVMPIELEGAPIRRRNQERFKEYFDALWKELDIHVQ